MKVMFVFFPRFPVDHWGGELLQLEYPSLHVELLPHPWVGGATSYKDHMFDVCFECFKCGWNHHIA